MPSGWIPVLILGDGTNRVAHLPRSGENALKLKRIHRLTHRNLTEKSKEFSTVEAVVFDGECRCSTCKGVIESLTSASDSVKVPLILLTTGSVESLPEPFVREAAYRLRKPVDERTLCAVIRAAVFEQDERLALRAEVRKRHSAVGKIRSGEFRIRTLEEAENLATMLSLACPDPERVALGARELLINAIEHGNLEIGYDEKSKMLAAGTWQSEIERRLRRQPYKDRFVRVSFSCDGHTVALRVEDQGKGFDYRRYDDPINSLGNGLHGRGLLFARELAFDEVRFFGNGNVVEARVACQADGGLIPGMEEE